MMVHNELGLQDSSSCDEDSSPIAASEHMKRRLAKVSSLRYIVRMVLSQTLTLRGQIVQSYQTIDHYSFAPSPPVPPGNVKLHSVLASKLRDERIESKTIVVIDIGVHLIVIDFLTLYGLR